MLSKAISYISEEEYFEAERAAETKSEYYDGEIFAMSGASRKHNLIVANVVASLVTQLRKKPCRVYPSQQWVLAKADDDNPEIFLEAIGCTLDISEVYEKTEPEED